MLDTLNPLENVARPDQVLTTCDLYTPYAASPLTTHTYFRLITAPGEPASRTLTYCTVLSKGFVFSASSILGSSIPLYRSFFPPIIPNYVIEFCKTPST